jgi:hypothetical protein
MIFIRTSTSADDLLGVGLKVITPFHIIMPIDPRPMCRQPACSSCLDRTALAPTLSIVAKISKKYWRRLARGGISES